MKFFVRTEKSTFYFTRVFPFHREVAAWARKRSLGTQPARSQTHRLQVDRTMLQTPEPPNQGDVMSKFLVPYFSDSVGFP